VIGNLCSEDLIFRLHFIKFTLTNTSSTSRILLDFKQPLPADALLIRSEPISFSEATLQQLRQHWQDQLLKKQSALFASGVYAEIKPYAATGNDIPDALFVDKKPVMWPGNAITLRDVRLKDGHVLITASEISYPFIGALRDAAFRSNLDATGLINIRPLLAICTFAITTDHLLILTVRGITTNVYPGRLYGQGGNPARLPFTIIEHQLDELKDELLINREEVDETSFRFYGLIEDLEQFPGKPDLIGTVRLKLSSSEVQQRFDTRSLSSRPPDAEEISMIPFEKKTMQHYLAQATKASDYCPPAFGGLVLLMQHEFGV
jgi:hypothetical protein